MRANWTPLFDETQKFSKDGKAGKMRDPNFSVPSLMSSLGTFSCFRRNKIDWVAQESLLIQFNYILCTLQNNAHPLLQSLSQMNSSRQCSREHLFGKVLARCFSEGPQVFKVVYKDKEEAHRNIKYFLFNFCLNWQPSKWII